MVITPRSVEPSLEQLPGTVSSNITTGLMGPFEESRDPVARYNNQVFMPQVGLVSFLLLLVDRDRFQTLLWAFIDIPKLLQVLNVSESI